MLAAASFMRCRYSARTRAFSAAARACALGWKNRGNTEERCGLGWGSVKVSGMGFIAGLPVLLCLLLHICSSRLCVCVGGGGGGGGAGVEESMSVKREHDTVE